MEAPAKPGEYYLLKQQYRTLGMYDAVVAELLPQFRGRFIDYGDPSMTAMAKGYAMQALFYHLGGEAFCNDPECSLRNAYWQEELVYAQLENGEEFCQQHQHELNQMNEDAAAFDKTP